MIRRYKLMEELGVRNIEVYNERSGEKMPFLVLIVDELADLMMVAGFEVEQNLVRLAQLGRAAGIHLLLATQRPSVNVVTGLLKANIPARCAFAVSGQVDSRVILDSAGAEKLMGKGDALILHKESPKAERMQGALVYDEEVEELVRFWTEQEGPPVPPINLESSEEAEGEDNIDVHQMDKARDLAIRNPNLSTSVLERRLKVGREASRGDPGDAGGGGIPHPCLAPPASVNFHPPHPDPLLQRGGFTLQGLLRNYLKRSAAAFAGMTEWVFR